MITADSHCGADVTDYRPYLASKFHDEFDAWAATYEVPFADLLRPDPLPQLGLGPSPRRARGRRDRGRGALPEHRPAVLRGGQPGRAAAEPGRLRAALGRCAGPQPLAGRLLRRRARPTGRRRPGLRQPARGRARRDLVGGRARRPSRRHLAALGAAQLRSPRALRPVLRPALAALRGARCGRSTSTRVPGSPTTGSSRSPGRSCWSSSRGSATARSGTSSSAGSSSGSPTSRWPSPSRAWRGSLAGSRPSTGSTGAWPGEAPPRRCSSARRPAACR